MTNKVDRLSKITRRILDASLPAYSRRSEVADLKSLLEGCGSGSFPTDTDISSGETRTEAGVAISPTMASMCIDDFARTVQFIRGIHAAIADVGQRISHRPVRVLYAGCGPLAPLAVPLMSIHSASAVCFTLVDIHQTSIDSVGVILDTLEQNEHVTRIETADATGYLIDPKWPPDIIVVEMMRAALDTEPQVAVARNLLRRAPDAIMIPEEVTLDLALMNASRKFDLDANKSGETANPDRIELGCVFRLNRGTLLQPVSEATIQLPNFDAARYSLKLRTKVCVYGDHVLADYDSGITIPKTLDIAGKKFMPGDTLKFTYQVGSQPRLNVERM